MSDVEHGGHLAKLLPVAGQVHGDPAVDARRLHGALGVNKAFTSWMKVQIRRAGLIEGDDFILLDLKGRQGDQHGGHNRVDYLLTADAAKHVAAMSSTETGKAVRTYLIEVEKNSRRLAVAQHFGVAHRLAALELERQAIERTGSHAGRALAKLRRLRQANDADTAVAMAAAQGDLFDVAAVKPTVAAPGAR